MSESAPAPIARRDVLTAIGIAAFACLVFAPALGVAFTSDDFLILKLIRELGGLQHPATYFRLAFYDYYRPIVFLSHALDWELWGPNPVVFHATNVALHALNALAVFFLARRLSNRAASILAALVFVVHPTNQETVFWVAGRFDLLATTALLWAVWLLGQGRRFPYWLGVCLFAIALLSKESGVVLLLIATAYDVLIARRTWQQTVARLIPPAVVAVAYMGLRSVAAGLQSAGGAHRAGKSAMLAAGVMGLLWMAYRREMRTSGGRAWEWLRSKRLAVTTSLALFAIALFVAGSRTQLGATIGFAWYAAYFLGPLAWIPSDRLITPGTPAYLAMGSAIVSLAIGVLLWGAERGRAFPAVVFALVVLAASLLPVSAMPSRNHLYLGTAAAALVLAAGLGRLRRSSIALLLAALLVVVGTVETVLASRDWRRAGVMTRDFVAVASADVQPCGTRELVVLIAPANIRGVPCNITEDAFRELSGCAPGALRAWLRVVGGDVIAAESVSGGHVRLRVRDYRGNLVGTTDMRRFIVQLPAGRSAELDTPLGRLTTRPDGADQVFDFALAAAARSLPVYYYSDGSMVRVAR